MEPPLMRSRSCCKRLAIPNEDVEHFIYVICHQLVYYAIKNETSIDLSGTALMVVTLNDDTVGVIGVAKY